MTAAAVMRPATPSAGPGLKPKPCSRFWTSRTSSPRSGSSAASAAAVAALEPLRGAEVREVQKRLQGFGFSPGPADGVAGRMTAAAVMNYQQSRGQARSGDIDRDLLEQL